MTLTLGHFLSLGAILFALSVIGIFLNRKNLIVLLMAIELMLLAVNMNFVAFSHYLGDMHGQVFVFFILTVAAAESAIGLAILVLLFRNSRTSTSTTSTRSRAEGLHMSATLSASTLLAVPLAPLVGAIARRPLRQSSAATASAAASRTRSPSSACWSPSSSRP